MEEQECLCDDRLNSLKDKLFLSEKIFKRVSENMHFEIFKYLSAEILLEIRITCLGGYQLCANKNLRNKMVKNYYRKLQINAQEYKKSSKEWNIRKARVIHEQTSSNLEINIIGSWNIIFLEHLKWVPNLYKLRLNIKVDELIFKGFQALANNIKYIPNLRILDLKVSDGEIDPTTQAEIRAFANNIKFLPNLEILRINKNLPNDEEGIIKLIQSLKYTSRLRSLDFCEYIGDSALEELANNLNSYPDLEFLALRSRISALIGNSTIELFALNLKYIPNIHTLILPFLGYKGLLSLAESLKYLIKLETFKFNGYDGNDENRPGAITIIAKNFKFIPNLLNLEFKIYNDLDEDSAAGLCQFAKNLRLIPNLQTLSWSDNGYHGNFGYLALARNLEYVPNLQILKFAYNADDPASVLQELGNNLKFVPSLHTIELNNTYGALERTEIIGLVVNLVHIIDLRTFILKTINYQAISELSLIHIPKLQILDLTIEDYSKGKIACIRKFAQNMKFVPNLKILKLLWMGIHSVFNESYQEEIYVDNELKILIENFQFVPNLVELSWSYYTFWWKRNSNLDMKKTIVGRLKNKNAYTKLFENLKFVPGLEKLQLSNIRLGDIGMAGLSKALKYIPNLRKLNLTKNAIGDMGIIELAENLRFIRNLCSLNINENSFEKDGLLALSANFHFIPKIQKLDLNDIYKRIGDNTLRILGESLSILPNLHKLDFDTYSYLDPGYNQDLYNPFIL